MPKDRVLCAASSVKPRVNANDVAFPHVIDSPSVKRAIASSARWRFNDREIGAAQFVRKAFFHDAAIACTLADVRGLEHLVTSHLAPKGPVHLLDDVAAHAELAKAFLPPRSEIPRAGPDPLGEPQIFQMLKSCRQQGLAWATSIASFAAELNSLPYRPSFDRAVEIGQPFLCHLALSLTVKLVLRAGPEFFGRELLRTIPQALGNIGAWQSHFATLEIHASNNNVGVWVRGVEVVDSRPFETLSEVSLHTRHEAPDVEVEV
jgi:hypothetical protein